MERGRGPPSSSTTARKDCYIRKRLKSLLRTGGKVFSFIIRKRLKSLLRTGGRFLVDLLQNSLKPPFLRGVGGINPFFCKRSSFIIRKRLKSLLRTGGKVFSFIIRKRLKSLLRTGEGTDRLFIGLSWMRAIAWVPSTLQLFILGVFPG
jgi:hypothetical protein